MQEEKDKNEKRSWGVGGPKKCWLAVWMIPTKKILVGILCIIMQHKFKNAFTLKLKTDLHHSNNILAN